MTRHTFRAKKTGEPKAVIYAGKRIPTFGVILKTNEKLIKSWNELLLVGFWETNKFDQKQFG